MARDLTLTTRELQGKVNRAVLHFALLVKRSIVKELEINGTQIPAKRDYVL